MVENKNAHIEDWHFSCQNMSEMLDRKKVIDTCCSIHKEAYESGKLAFVADYTRVYAFS